MNSPEPKKILFRGGSIPAGVGVSRSYVDLIKEAYVGRDTEIINRSRAGETSFEGVETFSQDVEAFGPDILVVNFGVDDAYSSVYRSEFKENLVRMAKLARSCSISRLFFSTSHVFENAFAMDAVNIFYRAIREVCADLRCGLIPIHTFWAGIIAEKDLNLSSLVQDDPRLPNEKGHELFAAAILKQLRQSVEI